MNCPFTQNRFISSSSFNPNKIPDFVSFCFSVSLLESEKSFVWMNEKVKNNDGKWKYEEVKGMKKRERERKEKVNA